MPLRPAPSRPPAVVAALLIFLCSAAGCRKEAPGDAPGKRDAAGTAEPLEAAGRWIEAAEVHERAALSSSGPDADAALQRAVVAYLMADRSDLARELASRTLARDPTRLEVLYYVGEGQRVLLQYEEAESALRGLLEKDPSHLRGSLSLGHVLLGLGDPASALPLFEEYVKRAPRDDARLPFARVEAARALRRLGRLRESADALVEVLEVDPHDPVALAEAAQTFAALRREDVARSLREEHAWLFARGHQVSSEDESKLLARGGDSPGARARKALEAADRRRFLPALEELERLRAASPTEPDITAVLGRLWLRLSRPAECLSAVRAFRTAIPPPGPHPALSLLEADALTALGQVDAAREGLRAASRGLAFDPGGDREAAADLHLRASLIEVEPGGDLEAGAAAIERAAASDPAGWKPLLGKARLLLARSDPRGALSLLEEAVGRGGRDSREVRRAAAEARGLLGDLRSAARDLMDLILKSPSDTAAFESFEKVFGSRSGEPEVSRVLELARTARERSAAREEAARALAAGSFSSSGPAAIALARERLRDGDRDGALDLLLLASDLEPRRTEALELAAGALERPRHAFLEIHLLRRILSRESGNARALDRLARAYLELGVRLGEAAALADRLAPFSPAAAEEIRAGLRSRSP